MPTLSSYSVILNKIQFNQRYMMHVFLIEVFIYVEKIKLFYCLSESDLKVLTKYYLVYMNFKSYQLYWDNHILYVNSVKKKIRPNNFCTLYMYLPVESPFSGVQNEIAIVRNCDANKLLFKI